jgi:hypothetical protein
MADSSVQNAESDESSLIQFGDRALSVTFTNPDEGWDQHVAVLRHAALGVQHATARIIREDGSMLMNVADEIEALVHANELLLSLAHELSAAHGAIGTPA